MKINRFSNWYISLCCFILPHTTYGQSAQWEWAVASVDQTEETARGVTTSPNGDVYIFGEYNSTLTLQDNTLQAVPGTIVVNAHVSKFNSNGEFLWSIAIGGEGSLLSVIRAGDTDSEGNCYIGGKILTQASELVIADSSITLPSGSSVNYPFIAKISPNGELVWINIIEPELETGIIAKVLFLEVNDNDEVYASGQIQGIYKFGEEIINTNSLYSGFLAKMDYSTGEFIWIKTLRANDSYSFSDIITTNNGKVYVSGGWAGDTLFADNQILINDMPLVSDNYDAFVASFSSNGEVELLERHFSSSSEFGGVFTKDEFDNVFIHYAINESLTVNGVQTTGPGLVRYEYIADAPAQIGWLIPGFTDLQSSNYGDSDSQGNLYYGGGFDSESIQIGDFNFQNSGGTSGTTDLFLLTINGEGEIVYATTFGGSEAELLYSVNVDANDRILLAGTFISPTMELGDFNLTNTGEFTPNLFVAALSDPLSISAVSDNVNLEVYPNPATTSIFIKNIPDYNDKINIELIDYTGRLVRVESSNTKEIIKMDVSDIPNGIYTIRVSASDFTSSSRIIVQSK